MLSDELKSLQVTKLETKIYFDRKGNIYRPVHKSLN